MLEQWERTTTKFYGKLNQCLLVRSGRRYSKQSKKGCEESYRMKIMAKHSVWCMWHNWKVYSGVSILKPTSSIPVQTLAKIILSSCMMTAIRCGGGEMEERKPA